MLDGEPLVDAQRAPLGTLLVLPAALDEPSPEDNLDRWLVGIVVGVGAIGVGLAIFIGRSVARPLETITETVGRVTRGDRTVRVDVVGDRELTTLAEAFNRLLDSLAHQEHLRRTLVSDVAHELRAPLTNIRYNIEAMQDGVVPVDAATLASALEDILRLGRLVDDLHELALADAGVLRIEVCAVDLRDELDSMAHAARPRMEANEITFELELAPDLPAVYADPARLDQIMRNLVDNAITHTPRNGRIRIEGRRLSDAEVVVCVADSGSGIAPEHLPNVFERFYRADASRTRDTGGAGLGLAIVKQLVDAQHGRVWVESVAGQGAAFSFTIPTTFIDPS